MLTLKLRLKYQSFKFGFSCFNKTQEKGDHINTTYTVYVIAFNITYTNKKITCL